MKTFITSFMCLLSLIDPSCKDVKVPEGFEIVSQDGRSLFILMDRKHWGDKVSQRQTARLLCTKKYKYSDYCEVYYFNKREDVPKEFPMVNRVNPIGYFEIKNGKEKFKFLGTIK